jgi:hypothetical protein
LKNSSPRLPAHKPFDEAGGKMFSRRHPSRPKKQAGFCDYPDYFGHSSTRRNVPILTSHVSKSHRTLAGMIHII